MTHQVVNVEIVVRAESDFDAKARVEKMLGEALERIHEEAGQATDDDLTHFDAEVLTVLPLTYDVTQKDLN